MSLTKPYFRIFRPILEGFAQSPNILGLYMLDERYANDRKLLCRSYGIIINDLIKVFEYIEPSDENLKTYSHRNFELLLRASTEFETNCKRILEANEYQKPENKDLNIKDYFKINKASKLSEYEVILEFWRPERKTIRPFEDWKKGNILKWYQDYNKVKHDRHKEFYKATLENTLKAVSGLASILFSQFTIVTFNPYQTNYEYSMNVDQSIFTTNSIFSLKPPNWNDNEIYQFDWIALKKEPNPFDKFKFDV